MATDFESTIGSLRVQGRFEGFVTNTKSKHPGETITRKETMEDKR